MNTALCEFITVCQNLSVSRRGQHPEEPSSLLINITARPLAEQGVARGHSTLLAFWDFELWEPIAPD